MSEIHINPQVQKFNSATSNHNSFTSPSGKEVGTVTVVFFFVFFKSEFEAWFVQLYKHYVRDFKSS